MWNLLVFALIGLLGGAAARLLYSGRHPQQILGTMLLGMIGGLIGGMLSWRFWPAVEGQFQSGNLFLSILGAEVAILFWAGVNRARNLKARRNRS